jgi:hypothetical protein
MFSYQNHIEGSMTQYGRPLRNDRRGKIKDSILQAAYKECIETMMVSCGVRDKIKE